MERGWGQRLEGTKFFEEDQHQKALDYVKNYNKDNNLAVTPDYYWYASSPTKVMVDS
jgi:hypothetical protein